jgi:hypothetical protein
MLRRRRTGQAACAWQSTCFFQPTELLWRCALSRAARKVTSEHGHRAIGGRRCAAEGWKPVDDDGSHPTLLLLKRRNTSDEPMTAGRAAHSLRIRFDFMLAARPCYSLHWTASIRWPETPACERPHAGVVWTRQIGPINWGGAGRIAALPFFSGAFSISDVSRPSATVSFL